MTDVLVIAVIVAFFVAGAVVVRLLDAMITRAGTGPGGQGAQGDEAELELEPGRRA